MASVFLATTKLKDRFKDRVCLPMQDVLGLGIYPSQIGEFLEALEKLQMCLKPVVTIPAQILPRSNGLLSGLLKVRKGSAPDRVLNVDRALLLTCLQRFRRTLAEKKEEPRKMTHNAEVIEKIDAGLVRLSRLMEHDYFDGIEPARVPALTEFMSIKHAEQIAGSLDFPEREYDEKFHILEAPRLFKPDLAYYRERCEFRGASVSVAFLDIDKFKAFNTKHNEQVVDRDMLPRFMSLLEAHVFSRGHAYRFGGDEYAIVLPNSGSLESITTLKALQRRLANATYAGAIEENPTVSIGLYEVTPDCMLTGSEILEKANVAKDHAKDAGRDCVAYFEGDHIQIADA